MFPLLSFGAFLVLESPRLGLNEIAAAERSPDRAGAEPSPDRPSMELPHGVARREAERFKQRLNLLVSPQTPGASLKN